MTKPQIKLLSTAFARHKLEEDQLRLILRNIGHVESRKDLSNTGLEDVMAFLEARGFPKGRYWRMQVENRGRFANSRQRWEIQRLALGREELLQTLVIQQSYGRVSDASKLRPREAAGVIEALKAILAREFVTIGAVPMGNATAAAGAFRKDILTPSHVPSPPVCDSMVPLSEEEIPF